MIKLIASDIDGTLLTHAGKINPRNIEALQQAQAQGMKVTIVTGRSINRIADVATRLGIKGTGIPFVAQNGGQVFSFESDGTINIRYSKSFSDSEVGEIFALCKQQRVKIFAYTFNEAEAYSNSRFGLFRLAMSLRSKRRAHYYKPQVALHSPITKFIVWGKRAAMVATRAALETAGYSVFAFSHVANAHQNIEVVPKGVNKALGLQYVADELGITAEEIIYFGDGENDVEALKWAGIGIAMGNARDHVQSIADAVTLSCQDGGVGCELEKYLKD